MSEALSEHRYNIISARASAIVDNITHSPDEKDDDNNECAITDKNHTMTCTDTTYKNGECASNENELHQVQELQRWQDSNIKHYYTPFAGSSSRRSESNCKYGSEASSTTPAWEVYNEVYVAPNTPYVYNKENKRGKYLEPNKKDFVRTSSFDANIHLGDVAANVNINNLSSNSIVNNNSKTKSYFAYQACTSNKDEYMYEKDSKASMSSTSQSINSQQLQPYVQLLRRQMQSKEDKVDDSNYNDEEKAFSPIFAYAFQRKLANRLRQKVAEAHNNNHNNNSISNTQYLSKSHKVCENSTVETEQGVPNVVYNKDNKFITLPYNMKERNKVTHSPIEMEMLEQPCSQQRKRTAQECNTSHSSETSKYGNATTNTITNMNVNKAHEYFVGASVTNKQTEHEEVARSLFASPMYSCLEENTITNKENKNSERNSVNRSNEEENITESCLLSSTLNKTPLMTSSSTLSGSSSSHVQSLRKILRCKEQNLFQERTTKELQSQEINYQCVKLISKEVEEHHPQEQWEESQHEQHQREEQDYRTNTQKYCGYRKKQACTKKSIPLCNVASTTTPMESDNELSKIWEESVKAKLEVALEKWQAVIYIKVMCLSMQGSLGVNHTVGKENGIETDTSWHSHEFIIFMERRAQLKEAIVEAEHASQCVAFGMRHYVEKMNAVILQLLNTHQHSFALQLLLKADELVREGAGMEFVLDKLTCNSNNNKKGEVKPGRTKASVTVVETNNIKNDNEESNSVIDEHVNKSFRDVSNTLYIDQIDAHVLALCCKMNTQRLPEEYCKYDTLLIDNSALPINVHVKHAIIHRSSTKSLEAQQRVQEMLSLHISYFTSAGTQERVYCTSITYNNFGLYHFHIAEYALAVVRLQEAASLEAQLPEQYVKLPGVTYLNLALAQFMAYKQSEKNRRSNSSNGCNGDNENCYPRKSYTYNFFRSLERATELTVDKVHNLTREYEQYVRTHEEKEEYECLCQLREEKKLQELKDHQNEESSSVENTIDDSFIIYQPDDANTHKATMNKNKFDSAEDSSINNVNNMSNTNMYCNTNAEHSVNEIERYQTHLADAQSKKSYSYDSIYTISDDNNKEANVLFADADNNNAKRDDSSYTRTLTLWLQKREQLCLLVKIKMVETELYESFHDHEHALEVINRAVMWCKQISHRTEDEERQLETILLLQRKIRQKCERQELERVMYGRTLQHNHRKNVKTANCTTQNKKSKSYTKSSVNPFELLHTRYTSIPVLTAPKHNACKSNNTVSDGHTHVATTLLPRTIHIIDEVQRRPISVPQPTNNLKLPGKKSNITKSKSDQESSHTDRCKTASRVQRTANKHISPYMVRQQMSSAPLRTRKAWDSDVHLSNTTTLKPIKIEQLKKCNAVASMPENSNNEDDNIVTTNDDDKTPNVGTVNSENATENNRQLESLSLSSSPAATLTKSSSSSSLFRTRLHASCEESKTINMMTTLISCADIVSAFIRYKLSKCVIDRKRIKLSERSGTISKTPCLLVQGTLCSEDNYQNKESIDRNSDGTQNTKNKSDKCDSECTTCNSKSTSITDSSSSAQCVNDNESKPTNSFEMLFVHSDCKGHHSENVTLEEASVSDHKSTIQILTS